MTTDNATRLRKLEPLQQARTVRRAMRAAADELDALRAEVERLKTMAEIGEAVMNAVEVSALHRSTARLRLTVYPKDTPCKP